MKTTYINAEREDEVLTNEEVEEQVLVHPTSHTMCLVAWYGYTKNEDDRLRRVVEGDSLRKVTRVQKDRKRKKRK